MKSFIQFLTENDASEFQKIPNETQKPLSLADLPSASQIYDHESIQRKPNYAKTNPSQQADPTKVPQIGGITDDEMARGESEYKRKQRQLANNTNMDPIAARVSFGPSAPNSDYLGGGVGGGLYDGLALIAPSKFTALGMLPGRVGKTAEGLGKLSELPNELVKMAAEKATGTGTVPLLGRAIGRATEKIFTKGVGLSPTELFAKSAFGVKD